MNFIHSIRNIRLKKCNNDTPSFGFNCKTKKAKVVNVVDGDTIDVVFKHNRSYSKFRCRLHGINTPEIRTSNQEEKIKGIAAKKYVIEKLLNELVILECKEFDNFGRLLIDILLNNENFNQKLINVGHAVKF